MGTFPAPPGSRWLGCWYFPFSQSPRETGWLGKPHSNEQIAEFSPNEEAAAQVCAAVDINQEIRVCGMRAIPEFRCGKDVSSFSKDNE